MTIPSKCICDLCKIREVKHYKQIEIPVLTNCNWTDGRSDKFHIEFTPYDLCDECILYTTRIYAGFQGSDPQITDMTEDIYMQIRKDYVENGVIV